MDKYLLTSILIIFTISRKSKIQISKSKLTSSEQPISDDLWKAFSMMLKSFSGGLVRSMDSVTPPVKSSIASELLPPFRDS